MWSKIKLILKSVRQYKLPAIITPIFMIGEVLCECVLPLIMSCLVDVLKGNADDIATGGFESIFQPFTYINDNLHFSMEVSIFWLIIVLIGLAIISLICGICGGIFAAKASVGLGTNLRDDLYKKIQTFSFSNIDKFSASSLVTRMTTDVSNVQMSFQMCIRIVIRAPLMMIFAAIMSFLVGGPMAWLFIILIPAIGFALWLLVRAAMGIFKRVFKRYDALNESVNENVSGIRVVKAYVREDFEKEKFNTASNNMTSDFIKAEKIIALNAPILNTSVHLANILIIGLGSYFIWSGDSLTVGQMSALLTYGIQILMSVQIITIILVMLVMSFECVNRIGEVLMEEPTITNPENPIMEVPNGDIKFENVNFKYFKDAEKDTLSDINLTIKSGQFIGILGSTGSGKTSVVNLISRLYDIDSGSLTVGDHDVKEYDLKTLRDAVAVVLQKNVLFSGTIASNLRWGNENATDEELLEALDIVQATEVANAHVEKLEHRVEQGGANYSGGQKQRLCIARAILKKPKILILDDSTSAVDTKTDKLIRIGLKERLPEMTKIVVAQRISSIEDADQIVIMDNGHIDAVGTHDELLKSNKIYQEVYYTQNKKGGDSNATNEN